MLVFLTYSANTRTESNCAHGPIHGPRRRSRYKWPTLEDRLVQYYGARFALSNLPQFRNFVKGDTGWRDGR